MLAQRPALVLVLDVGCGTGQRAFDLCAEFPSATVVGLDLEPSRLGPGSNVSCEATCSTGRHSWTPPALHDRGSAAAALARRGAELVRVTRPGGWIELVEPTTEIEPVGPASTRLFEMGWRLARSLGLDTTGIVFRSLERYLERAGTVEIESRIEALRIGEWGGRVGSFMATDLRAGLTMLCGVFQARFDLPAEEGPRSARSSQAEWERERSRLLIRVTFGRKPG